MPALAALLCAPALEDARAGAWTQKESEGSAYLQTIATSSDQAFDGDGDLFAAQTYDKVSTQLFLEYGASDWLTLLVAPELVQIDVGAPASAGYSGFGYTEIGARLRLAYGENWIVSAQGLARIPGAKANEGVAAIGYLDGEAEARFMVGLTFEVWELPSFLDLEVAQRFRTGAAPDEIHFDATLGVRVAPQWLLLAQSFNVISEGAGEAPVFGLSYEYYKVQAGGMYDVTPHFSLLLAVVSTWYARNAPQENGIVGAALYRY
ncbi:hypothetical protein ABLE91_08415 [Aquabacter sp. CN5-332]|uniref:hypothetical protein n=1 Tax=Aquabacter sp. CN5-332 TaxID=3156608 RepID=UPI0032B62316